MNPVVEIGQILGRCVLKIFGEINWSELRDNHYKRFLTHCVKSVRIRSYSGPYFPALGLNTEKYINL